MEVSNRVLTVSYGTFSCSLEGFDDPFSTLQQVAEYFRKLSAEDRFFGGEPQVPDNTTIHKIAEAANPNKVEAEVQDSGIILRQQPEPDLDLVAAEALPLSGTDEGQNSGISEEDREAEKRRKRKNRKARNKAKKRSGDGDARNTDPQNSVFRTRRQRIKAAATAPDESDGTQQSVEETLAKIRQNVEQAEDDIINAEVSEPVETLQLGPEMIEVSDNVSVTPEFKDEPAAVEVSLDVENEPVESDLAQDDTSSETRDAEFESVDVVEITDAVVETSQEDVTSLSESPAEVETTAADVSDQSELSAAAEADLAAALTGLDTETKVDLVNPNVAERRKRRRERAEAQRQSSDAAREDEALDRLLQTTNQQMDGPERQRRSNALDQLKAAVIATEADRLATDGHLEGENPDTEDDLDDLAAYRADLKKAQRKSRGRTQRPDGNTSGVPAPAATPAPLILVSEQRIADPEDGAAVEEPAEFREAAEIDGNLALKPEPLERNGIVDGGIPASAFRESSSFRDFADQIGAVTLQDMLEAAAAYTSIVEGKPRFSRAQVMSKLAKISTSDAFSKEAGLRSFGKLLREGKILRVQDGQFAISKSSRFSIASRYGT